jgi:hypothetical protein
MRRATPVLLVFAVLFLGCGNADQVEVKAPPAADLDPDDPTILMRPFTAEEIRDEWVPGFRLLIRRGLPVATRTERWTVVSADDEGVEIEYATIADDGSVEGEPSINRSTWTELRDHAAFPAAYTTREWVSRSTTLGNFEGWFYRVAEPGDATVQEFFFVPSLPGAPVQMRIIEEDTTVFVFEQTARLRPNTD